MDNGNGDHGNSLKALETWYAGHLFRSRREARWMTFFKTAEIDVQYEEQGYDLGKAGWYLPDFLVNPGTPSELFFEVKGKRPSRDELAKAEMLAEQSGRPVYVYFDQVRLPAPASLTGMSHEVFFDAIEQDNQRSWAQTWLTDPQAHALMPAPSLRHTWADECGATAFRAFTRNGIGYSRELPLWWTDCPYCGLVVPKLYGQVGCCPKTADTGSAEILYPHFRHATKRLLTAYAAAASERFDSRRVDALCPRERSTCRSR